MGNAAAWAARKPRWSFVRACGAWGASLTWASGEFSDGHPMPCQHPRLPLPAGGLQNARSVVIEIQRGELTSDRRSNSTARSAGQPTSLLPPQSDSLTWRQMAISTHAIARRERERERERGTYLLRTAWWNTLTRSLRLRPSANDWHRWSPKLGTSLLSQAAGSCNLYLRFSSEQKCSCNFPRSRKLRSFKA